MEQQAQKKSSRMLWVVIGAVVVFFVVLGISIYLIVQSNTKKTATSPVASTVSHVATQAEVQQSLSNLSSSIKKAQSAQASAKTILNDSKTQTKVGN